MIQATSGPATNYRPDAWDGEEGGSEQHPPQAAPEGAHFVPVLHAVAGVIVSDDVLIGMIIFANDGHFLHVKPRPLQFLDCFLSLGVGFVNGYDQVGFRHELRSFFNRSPISARFLARCREIVMNRCSFALSRL
jgi:hypothetical protein